MYYSNIDDFWRIRPVMLRVKIVPHMPTLGLTFLKIVYSYPPFYKEDITPSPSSLRPLYQKLGLKLHVFLQNVVNLDEKGRLNLKSNTSKI